LKTTMLLPIVSKVSNKWPAVIKILVLPQIICLLSSFFSFGFSFLQFDCSVSRNEFLWIYPM
jgi:hypothetical protein